MFDAVLTKAISMRANIHQTAFVGYKKKQRRYNRRPQVLSKIKVGQKVLM